MKKRLTRKGTAAAIFVAALAGGAVVAANASPRDEAIKIPAIDIGLQDVASDGAEGAIAEASNCHKTFTSGSGDTLFEWCFSDDGNIAMLQHSEGLEHIAVGSVTEGWCASAGHIIRGQTSGDSANFGLDEPSYPDTKSVTHQTLDGSLRVKQTFSQQSGKRMIVITMTVTNISGGTLNNVYLTRFVDADLSNSTGSDVWSAGPRSVAAYEPGSSRLELIPRSYRFPANSLIYSSFFPEMDEDCYDAAADVANEAEGDRAMGVFYQLGTIFAGEEKRVKFVYLVNI